jgi:hypothetical protein
MSQDMKNVTTPGKIPTTVYRPKSELVARPVMDPERLI